MVKPDFIPERAWAYAKNLHHTRAAPAPHPRRIRFSCFAML